MCLYIERGLNPPATHGVPTPKNEKDLKPQLPSPTQDTRLPCQAILTFTDWGSPFQDPLEFLC